MRICFVMLLAVALAAAPGPALGQNGDFPHAISAGVGASLFGAIFNAPAAYQGQDFSSGATPVLGATYDYGLSPAFSLGASVAYQRFRFDCLACSVEDPLTGQTLIGDFGAGLGRTNVALRILGHYANKGAHWDLYSGGRLGVSLWGLSITGDVAVANALTSALASGVLPSLQLIPFGARGYFSERVGAYAELGLGTPHYLSGGLMLRLGQ